MDDITSNPLFQLAPVAYSVLDLDLNQVAANERFFSLFGHESGVELDSESLTLPEDRQATKEYIERVLRDEDPGSIDKRYVRADGSVFWARLTARLIKMGETPYVVGVIEDIQQQHDLLQHLALSMQEATEQAELRARFVSQVSHELRNPLHLIAGTSELLSSAPIPMKHRQQAASILREARSLTRLTDDLLDIGRSDAGKLEIDEVVFSSRSLVDRVRQTVAASARSKGLDLDVHVHDSVPVHLSGDEGRLHQILVNLASNAVKFTQRGSISVNVDVVDAGAIRFRVTDSGPGIPEAGLQTIFEPFVRFSRVESGAGLGLAISSRLAHALKGSLTVENVAPSGAAFSLIVPLETAHPPSIEEWAPVASTTASPVGGHILIVEDSVENQLLASAQLEAVGFTFEIAGDGFKALELVKTTRFDAILMDWHLPGMDGLETTRRIRAGELDANRGRVPIIALTARTMAADIEACFDAGADDHVSKPAGLDTLRRVLTRWTAGVEALSLGAGNQSALIERTALEELFDNLGDVDLVASIVSTYLVELKGRVGRIVEAESPESVESAAHVLASTSSIVGASSLSELARRIEKCVRGLESVDDELLEDLVKTADATMEALTTEFDQLKVGT